MIDNITGEKLANDVIKQIKEKFGKIDFPIDPFKLLKDAGVHILLKDFENLDGIIINDEDNVTIVGINNNRSLSRQRFTAAHEYCHFIKDLKKESGKNDIIRCLKNSKSSIERFADSFAAHLLMPKDEFKKICNKYKNNNGYIDFESVTIIAEYFGVSFSSCLNSIAYDLKMIEGDITPKTLRERIKIYSPSKQREKLIKNKIDSKLLSNMLMSLSYNMLDLNKYTGMKFLQNYIYFDNKLEGIKIDRSNLNYILADLNYNKQNSQFFNSENEAICMTLGNLELQRYVILTKNKISIKNCNYLHKLLYKFVPYPDDNGKYRDNDAILKRGTIQPVSYVDIPKMINKLDEELQCFLNNISKYNVSEYIEQIAYFVYQFIVIHPFKDGNGRISRALLNWMLSLKNLPPIYINDDCREEYYNVLTAIDLKANYTPFIMFIEKRIINTMMELHNYLFVDDIDLSN